MHNHSRTDGMEVGVDLIQFNASKSEAIYSGASVQAPALQTLIIIKIWQAGGWAVVALPNISLEELASRVTLQEDVAQLPLEIFSKNDLITSSLKAPVPDIRIIFWNPESPPACIAPVMFGLNTEHHRNAKSRIFTWLSEFISNTREWSLFKWH